MVFISHASTWGYSIFVRSFININETRRFIRFCRTKTLSLCSTFTPPGSDPSRICCFVESSPNGRFALSRRVFCWFWSRGAIYLFPEKTTTQVEYWSRHQLLSRLTAKCNDVPFVPGRGSHEAGSWRRDGIPAKTFTARWRGSSLTYPKQGKWRIN